MNDISYINCVSMSDKTLMESLGTFIKYHRLNQNRTQREVADAAAMSRSTLSLLERGEGVTLATFIQALRALNLLEVLNIFQIIDQTTPLEPAIVAHKKRQQRQRASPKE
jgi:transcriptional regulator with XRE-family HTH domain